MAVGGSIIYEIEADTTKFNSTMQSIGQSFTKVGETGGSAGASFGDKFMNVLQKYDIAGKIKGLLGDAFTAGGSLEQSIGGIETLFKDTADVMIENANRAYETAGMSANQYMETVTSFSASLLQGLKGDTEAAAAIADRAVQDMSDNANKFGTDISMIQSAYQGFAKQNYTMLDNLKLGYGGTKTEMERLIKDAAKMTESMDALGITIDANSMSFDNIANAISVVQHNMGVMGTTADEAKGTLQGAEKAMKGAFENLLASLALGEDAAESVGPALDKAIEATGVYLQNVLRMAGNIAAELPKILFDMVGRLIDEGIPAMAGFIEGLGEGMAEGIPQMLDNILPMILGLTDRLRENFGKFVDAGLGLLLNIAQGIANGIPKLVAYVPQIISNIAGLINDNMPKILETGVKILMTLGEGIINAIPAIISNIGNIVKAIFDVIQAVNWISLGTHIITFIKNGLVSMIQAIPNTMKNIVQEGRNAIIRFDWGGLGRNIIDGIANGIRAAASAIASALTGAVSNAWNGAKKLLGIKSPSTLMRDTIGKNISLGVAEGIEDEAESVNIATNDMLRGIEPSITLGGISQSFHAAENQDIINLLQQFLPQIAENKEVVLDTGALVGEMAGGINRKMGLIYNGEI